jgi:hypothetical protein
MATTHIRTTKKNYFGVIILYVLFILSENSSNGKSLSQVLSSTLGIIASTVVLYALYKIFFGKGKIILTESAFKVQGYNWITWDELTSIYPFIEQDSENGERHFINFRLIDGSDISVRSENLVMTFGQIAALVNQYKMKYKNKRA